MFMGVLIFLFTIIRIIGEAHKLAKTKLIFHLCEI